jgi:hypothetical protein
MQLWPKKLAPSNRRYIIKSWQISCRYVFIFRISNSINPINHNLSFCEPKSSIPFVKCVFVKFNFTKGMLDLASQKLRLWLIGLMEFNFLKTKTYIHEICHLLMIHLQIGGANFLGQSCIKGEKCWKIHFFPNKVINFTNKAKFLTPIK